MERLRRRRDGFTLVELLVVIAIITVLIAIALPVYSRAKEKARQTACMANLHQLAMAVRMYGMDMGSYPGPYDPATGEGGLNALYPAYIDNRRALICPDDAIESGEQYVAQSARVWDSPTTFTDIPYADLLAAASRLYEDQDPTGQYLSKLWRGQSIGINQPTSPLDPAFFIEHYSSYNDLYNYVGYVGEDRRYSLLDRATQYLHKGDNLGFWYAWYQWDPKNAVGIWDGSSTYGLVSAQLQYQLAQQTYWNDYDAWNFNQEYTGLQDGLRRPLWERANPNEMPYGMPSAVFPGLINRNAPENTIVTRCRHHRSFTRAWAGKDASGNDIYWEKDIALRLDGSCVLLIGLNYDWAVQPQGQ